MVFMFPAVSHRVVLGPLLFIMYLEDLIRAIVSQCKHTTVYAYADDIKLMSTDYNDLQKALDVVNMWIGEWGLLLNKSKSEHLVIRNKDPKTLYIGHQPIPKVSFVRDLGLTLTDDLSSKQYIGKIRARANTLSHILHRTFLTHNHTFRINLFKIYIRPILEYNTCSWSPHLQSDIKSVESVQRRYTKIVCQKSNIKFSNYSDRLKILNLDSLQTRRDKNDLTMLYKIIYGLVDIDFSHLFCFSNFHGHNLRRHNLHIERHRPAKSLVRQSFFSNRTIKHWNNLPSTTVNSLSIAIFKLNLKDWQS